MKCERPACSRKIRRRGLCYIHLKREINAEGVDFNRRPIDRTRDHILWLMDNGVRQCEIAAAVGIAEPSVRLIRTGKRAYVRSATEAAILTLRPGSVPPNPHSLVPAIGAVRRLRALYAIGYTAAELADKVDLCHDTVRQLINGSLDELIALRLGPICSTFERLQMTPAPPSVNATRSILRAQRNGWHPPLAWDEDAIDDPNAQPRGAEHRALRFPEKYTEMADLGMTEWEIVDRLGITFTSLKRQLERYEMPISATVYEMVQEERQLSKEAA